MPPEIGARSKIEASAAFPTGDVTFLFSDIEGSTQRWEAYTEAMKVAVARHEQLVGDAIVKHGGYVFKSLGDAFCAAFHSAVDAVAAAADAQLALAGEDFSAVDGLRVRMGLHTGQAEERKADYFGPAVNRVARLTAIGHGGQVLLSGSTHALAQHDLPAGTALIDMRSHRLKDLTEPERIWQMTIAGLPSDFPPLNSLDARPNNLPVHRTSFVGRDRDLAEVKSLLDRHRLVTLCGAGGVGKTRLALQAGADLLDRYPDGVWFADLAPIGDPDLVPSVVANVVGMKQRAGQAVDESLRQWLKRKQLLLVLDNCEHVLEAAASLADKILMDAPEVRMLATSRQALGIGGEKVVRVASLDVPAGVVDLTAEAALGFDSVALFVDRASLVDASFVLSPDTVPIVAEICRRLDGIPFAIELAAARVKVLSIPNLARRLDERFKVLTGGSRTALPRQRTLTALIDWSHDLLEPQEKAFFNRTGVFAGSFDLAAAIAVCAPDADEMDVVDLLSSLVDKSLIVADTSRERERYRLLESTRAYAIEKLTAEGERDRLRRRHAEYFRKRAEEADASYGRGSTFAWFDAIELDLDNFRAALDWGLSQGHDPVVAAAIAGSLGQLWYRGGLIAEGRHWMETALERLDSDAHPRVAARLWHGLASLYSARQMYEAAQRALALYEAADDAGGAAAARRQAAWGLTQMGRVDEAMDATLRALEDYRKRNDDRGVANCLLLQASIARAQGRLAGAREAFAQALAIFKRLHHEIGHTSVLTNLAELEFNDGHPDRALDLITETLSIKEARPMDTLSFAIEHANRTAYLIALGRLVEARESAGEALKWCHQSQDPFITAIALQHAALLFALIGETRAAAVLLGYVDARFVEIDYTRETTEQWSFDKLVALLRAKLTDAELSDHAAEGATWSEDQAVETVLLLADQSEKSQASTKQRTATPT